LKGEVQQLLKLVELALIEVRQHERDTTSGPGRIELHMHIVTHTEVRVSSKRSAILGEQVCRILNEDNSLAFVVIDPGVSLV
jgi:hypothetical protein